MARPRDAGRDISIMTRLDSMQTYSYNFDSVALRAIWTLVMGMRARSDMQGEAGMWWCRLRKPGRRVGSSGTIAGGQHHALDCRFVALPTAANPYATAWRLAAAHVHRCIGSFTSANEHCASPMVWH